MVFFMAIQFKTFHKYPEKIAYRKEKAACSMRSSINK